MLSLQKDENRSQLAWGGLHTEQGNVPSWHARFALDGAAAMREFHVIQGPNTRNARDKITFFAFHAFLVEDSRIEQKSSQGPFSSPEAALLLVRTKNCDLWPHSGQMSAHA